LLSVKNHDWVKATYDVDVYLANPTDATHRDYWLKNSAPTTPTSTRKAFSG